MSGDDLPLYHAPTRDQVTVLRDISTKLRIHCVKMTQASKSGHPTSCSSMAELMSVLFFRVMKYKDPRIHKDQRDPANDRFVLSKGHAAPILYAAWAEAGLFPTDDLANLRKISSDLEGHPTPRLSFIDVATGSLGQGLSVAAGMAYCGKFFDKSAYRTYCLLGDGESMEGNVWEALNFAGHYKLDNLCAIIDVNRLGQSDPAPLAHDLDTYRKRLSSFGWNAIVVDGHDVEEICKAFFAAECTPGMPTAILAKTYKGKDFPGIEDEMNWHGKPLGDKAASVLDHLASLITNPAAERPSISAPAHDVPEVSLANVQLSSPPEYNMGDKVATREAYGRALAKLVQAHPRVVALDGDMKNSTFSQNVIKIDKDRFIECFICEQNLVGVGIGVSCRDRTIAFVSTFAAFLTRAFDNLRMGVISQTNINVMGSHCGVSIGEDGPSQMALEDLAMFSSLPGATVFYPSDAVSMEAAVQLAANTRGVSYLRATRPALPVLYSGRDTVFRVGEARVVRQSEADQVLVVAAGVTLHEAMKAADTLAAAGVNIRVMDPFTIKPLDWTAVQTHSAQCSGRVVTVEDHYPEGGLGDAVLASLAMVRNTVVKKLAVSNVPRSGPPAELLQMFGISASSIVNACHEIIKM